MKYSFSNNMAAPGTTIVLVLLTIVVALIAIPLLIVVAFCFLVNWAITGLSPLAVVQKGRERRRKSRYEGPSGQDRPRNGGETSASADDTIECEVISARSLDENGQEIR